MSREKDKLQRSVETCASQISPKCQYETHCFPQTDKQSDNAWQFTENIVNL